MSDYMSMVEELNGGRMNPLCKGCNKPIIWATTPEGTKVPLDPKPPVYKVTRGLDGRAEATRMTEVFVTHFSTCSKENDFSASNRKAQQELTLR